MSASLVGSEMCIRDRHHAGQQQEQATASQSRTAAAAAGRHRRAARCMCNCLLYTSDAADDM
eukprot:3051613-Alexandrium_andersonii.AAC.1